MVERLDNSIASDCDLSVRKTSRRGYLATQKPFLVSFFSLDESDSLQISS
jgi:hypothetical protein